VGCEVMPPNGEFGEHCDLLASVVRPVRELKAFGRVEMEAGQSMNVSFCVPVDMLGFTGAEGVRIVEPGVFEVQIGAFKRRYLVA
jgi:hypothetical protein